MIDNKSSTALKDYLKNGISFQFVLPHMHRRNAAERAMRTFKNHFIAILCGAHPDFPLCMRCKLLPQAETTLDMTRPCRSNPKLSAYSSLEGEFSCDHIPLAPLGAKVIGFYSPTIRQTWAPHCHYTWLIVLALDHYRCFTIFNPKTKGTSIAHTFHWSESNRFKVTKITPEEKLTVAAADLATALRSKKPILLPDDHLRSNIKKLCDMFQSSVQEIMVKNLNHSLMILMMQLTA